MHLDHSPSCRRDCHLLGNELIGILVGDWNFVENRHDKSNNCGHLASEYKKLVFLNLITVLQIEDRFPSSNQICYSWDNKRWNGERVLARLDKVYAFQDVGGQQTMTHYKVLGDSNHSNHLPVKYRILLKPSKNKRRSSYKMGSLHLKNPSVIARINRIWNENSGLSFFNQLKKCVKFYREFCVQKAKEWRQAEMNMRKLYEEATALLQANPKNMLYQSSLSKNAAKLKLFESKKVAGQRV